MQHNLHATYPNYYTWWLPIVRRLWKWMMIIWARFRICHRYQHWDGIRISTWQHTVMLLYFIQDELTEIDAELITDASWIVHWLFSMSVHTTESIVVSSAVAADPHKTQTVNICSITYILLVNTHLFMLTAIHNVQVFNCIQCHH